MGRKRARYVQRTLGQTGWGGSRAKAGRKKSADSGAPHTRREDFRSMRAAHVTMRIGEGLGSLREELAFEAVKRVFAAIRGRADFWIVHFSVQEDHLHLVVEALDRSGLSKGMRSLASQLARSLNKVWCRKGKVFPERHHEVLLEAPMQARNVLGYVLNNSRKHGARLPKGVLDPFSSADSFDGWTGFHVALARTSELVSEARTWLLRVGWRMHGAIDVGHRPGRKLERHDDRAAASTSARPPAARAAPRASRRAPPTPLLPFAQAV